MRASRARRPVGVSFPAPASRPLGDAVGPLQPGGVAAGVAVPASLPAAEPAVLHRRVPRLAGTTAALGGITLLSAILRFAFLGRHSVWLDEAYVAWIAQHPWRGILALVRAGDQHPPLYYLLMHAWIGVAGTGEAALRLPSACCGVAAVPLTYLLARRSGVPVIAWVSPLLVAVSPFHIMAAQEARMYPFVCVFAIAATLALAAAAGAGGALRWGTYAAVSTLLVYTHYLGVLILIAHGCWVAGWARRSFPAWTAAMLAVAVLFAPWAPAFFDQFRHLHGFALYYDPVPLMYLTDLLVLWAFGGSLFGMAGYFFNGTARLIEHIIVLLPFVMLLWRGTVSCSGDRRMLALAGLPPLVTVGVFFGLSLAGPLFVPRWFSFFVPFIAIVTAYGINDVADHLRTPRAPALAALLGMLLLYQLPVLDRYYFDPEFRPFRWRGAAALVQQLARPGDGVVIVAPAGLPFRYYFHASYPSVELPPGRFTLTEREVRQLALEHRRLWLIATLPFTADTRDRLIAGFRPGYDLAALRNFSGAVVGLLQARAVAP